MPAASRHAGTQLPRLGGGSKDRAQLAEIQRRRIVLAMIEVASERGGARVTVAHVVARSGVSRRTFYELFVDSEECLLAAVEESLVCAAGYVRDIQDPLDPLRTRIRRTVHALLCFFEDEPARGRLLVVETLSGGKAILRRRSEVLAEIVAAVEQGSRESSQSSAVTALTAEGVVGSALSVVHARLLKSASPALVELTNPLTSLIVLPYLGTAAARKELERPLPERRQYRRKSANGTTHLSDLPMRITYRTICVLREIAARPGASNRQIAQAVGIADQGQMSKLLQRLERLGLIINVNAGQGRGLANVWRLTPSGAEVESAVGRSRSAEE